MHVLYHFTFIIYIYIRVKRTRQRYSVTAHDTPPRYNIIYRHYYIVYPGKLRRQ